MRPALPAVLILAALLAACGKSQDSAGSAGEPATAPASASASAPVAGEPPEASEAEQKAVIAALPAPFNTGDFIEGKRLFAVCRSCHTIDKGGSDMTGPNLHGVFTRKIGTEKGFQYSNAAATAGFMWDPQHLDQWLAGPRTFLPGAKMTFAGFPDEKDRINVISYVAVESQFEPNP